MPEDRITYWAGLGQAEIIPRTDPAPAPDVPTGPAPEPPLFATNRDAGPLPGRPAYRYGDRVISVQDDQEAVIRHIGSLLGERAYWLTISHSRFVYGHDGPDGQYIPGHYDPSPIAVARYAYQLTPVSAATDPDPILGDDGFVCDECREEYPVASWHGGDSLDSDVCAHCWDRSHFTCEDCGNEFPNDDESPSSHVCQECYDGTHSPCSDCDDSVSDDDLESVGDRSVCRSCLNRHYNRCRCCEEYVHDDDTADSTLCQSCYEDSYFTCDGCDSVCPNDEYGQEGQCSDCWDDQHPTCNDCGTDVDPETSHRWNDHHVCADCVTGYESPYTLCRDCASLIHRNESDRRMDGRCRRCHHNRDRIIQDYGAKADRLGFKGIPKDKLFLGVELEVEVTGRGANSEDKAKETLDSLGRDFIITKYDGSLNNGFEIVTAPASLDVHRERWEGFLANPPSGLRSWKTDSCGLHVHASRAAISPLSLGKLLVFLNLPANRAFVAQIAGRDSCHYAKAVDKKPTDSMGPRGRSGDRYEWLNLLNPKTVEFRLFRGTLGRTGVLRALEFVVSSIKFSGHTGLSALRHSDYLSWIGKPENRKAYPVLASWLVSKGYLPSVKKPRPNTPVLVTTTNEEV